ncbi:hypothetical protein ACFOGQ_10955 [Acinetobacter vivianii]
MTRFVLPPLDSTWRTIPLGALAEIKYGSALPSASRAVGGVVPVYGSGGVVGSHDKPLHSEKVLLSVEKALLVQFFLHRGPFGASIQPIISIN